MDKNHKDPTKMTIVFTRGKNRDIFFDDTRTREEFYQTVSQIKHIHKSDTAIKNLNVSVLMFSVFMILLMELDRLFLTSLVHLKIILFS